MKSARHAKIVELVTNKNIENQDMLIKELETHGFKVTQSTISRDIKHLRLIKQTGENGKTFYTIQGLEENNISKKFHQIFADSVISVDYAINMVVIKSYTGMAMAACAALDKMQLSGMLGTIAGDDTIFIVMRSEEHAKNISKEIFNLIKK